MRGGEEGRSKHSPSPGQPYQTASSSTESNTTAAAWTLYGSHFFLKILKQQIMACTLFYIVTNHDALL